MSDRSGPERQIFAPCTACDTLWPIQDLTPKTGICPNCIERDRIRADVQRSRLEARRVLRELVTQQRGKKIDSPHISEMCAEMIRSLGGLPAFCQGLVEDYLDARERSPGSATLLRFGADVFRLVKESSAQRDTAPDAVNMTDDELAAEMLGLMEQAARRQHIAEPALGLLEMWNSGGFDELGTREDKGEDGTPGAGSQDEADGGPEVLSPDEPAA